MRGAIPRGTFSAAAQTVRATGPMSPQSGRVYTRLAMMEVRIVYEAAQNVERMRRGEPNAFIDEELAAIMPPPSP